MKDCNEMGIYNNVFVKRRIIYGEQSREKSRRREAVNRFPANEMT